MGSTRAVVASVWVRLALSAALVSVVVWQVGLGDVTRRIADADPLLLAAAVGALAAAFAVGAGRWRLFLHQAGVDRPFGAIVRVTFIGAFTTNFLPGTVGGDAARAWLVGPGNRVAGLATVIVDRVSLFACSVLLGWIAIPVAGAPTSLLLALAAATLVVVVAFVLITGVLGLGARLGRRVGSRVGDAGEGLIAAARTVMRSRRVLVWGVLLGLLYQALVVLEVWLLADAASVDLSYAMVAVVTPPVLLLSALPLSIGGFGVRELSYVALLAAVGVDAADAAVLSLLAGVVYATASLPGAVGLVWRTTLADAARAPRRAPADGVVSRSS